jgi:hypothetical protein
MASKKVEKGSRVWVKKEKKTRLAALQLINAHCSVAIVDYIAQAEEVGRCDRDTPQEENEEK